MPRIVIIAGEASGDLLAGGLITELQKLFPQARIEGVTGPAMRAAGCESWADIDQLSVMGLLEVVRHLPRIYRLKKAIEKRLRADPPDILIGVDAPDFNLRIEKFARSLGIKTVQYVCPSVWAWRTGRVKTLRAACDHVLCLLPFEPDFLREHNVSAHFVGHPLADEIDQPVDPQVARQDIAPGDGQLVALLPGSRRGEIEQLGPPFLQAARLIARQLPSTRFCIAAASPAMEAIARQQCESAELDVPLKIISGRTRDVLAAADAVLLASGTATLETMLMHRPMVVAYRASAFTAWLLRRPGLVRVQRFSLPNLLADKELVPELIQEQVTPEALADEVCTLLTDSAARERMLAGFRGLAGQLKCSANVQAAAEVARILAADS